MNISLILPTIGHTVLYDCLDSMKHPPDELIVVVDMIGRSLSPLKDQPVDQFEADLKARYPFITKIVRNETYDDYQCVNQNFNIGLDNASNKYVLFTHDDTAYQDYDYFGKIKPVLDMLEADGGKIDGKTVWGVSWPWWEAPVPELPEGWMEPRCYYKNHCLSHLFGLVSTVINRDVFNHLGGKFDTEAGIWYDAIIETEMALRDWWTLHLPMPFMRHYRTKTFPLNNWMNGWSHCPKWGNFHENFMKVYGIHDIKRNVEYYEDLKTDRYKIAL